MTYKQQMKQGLEHCLHEKVNIHSFSVDDSNRIHYYTKIYAKIRHIGKCEIAWISENIPNTVSICHLKSGQAIKLIMHYASLSPKVRN